MSKRYDFGYELEVGSTNEWAFNQVKENSKVLELGAAVGNITKHLKENKGCEVDIIEVDEESGSLAKQFARKALLGFEDGNLNGDKWLEILSGEEYDYVVILDVLEHLDNPKNVLKNLKGLLKESGKIITSIPNVSNNAVIINLLNDKFEYTELGLLDKTHKYFMTYDSIVQMIDELDYNLDYISAIVKDAGMSEVSASYDDVSEDVAEYIKNRKFGTAYQYLCILGKEKTTTINELLNVCKRDIKFKSLIMFNGLSEGMLELENSSREIFLEFELDSFEKIESIRFVPDEHACEVLNLNVKVWRDGVAAQVEPNWTSGVKLDSNSYILGSNAQEMNFILDGDESKMQISCECFRVYENALKHVEKCMETIKSNQEYIENQEVKICKNAEWITHQDILLAQKDEMILQKDNLIAQRDDMIAQKDDLIAQRDEIIVRKVNELEEIKSTLWYRAINKIKRIGKR